MDPHKKALIIAWLQDSPSSPDIPIENEEIIRVHRMILQYQNDNGIPQIEDTEFVSARSLLNKAETVSGQLTNLKQSLQKVSKILKGFNIPVEETMRGLDNLKQTVDTAIKAENVKTTEKNVEVVPEQIQVEPDIYIDSNSQMETEEVECIDLTMDTDSETLDVTVENYGRQIKKKGKPASRNLDSMLLLH